MRGPKLNEGATQVGVRSGTKATAKYVRSSAYKARVVLDLIRGLDVRRADEVLQFTDRGIAHDIRKVLASAVANATDETNGAYLGEPEELFVIACFADEGPTMKRFKPGSRGRASRIRKRSCHITVIVARMSDERVEIVRARAEGASGGAATNRRQRVERSRKRAEAAKAGVDAVEATETVEDAADHEDVDATEVDVDTDGAIEVQAFAEVSADDAAPEPADESEAGDDDAVETVDAVEASGDFAASEYAGGVLPDADGNGPDTHPIKGNADSMLYHTPESRYYTVTKAEVWFDTEANAEAAGFSAPATTTQSEED
jgi:large subunit ribosomal protein L22